MKKWHEWTKKQKTTLGIVVACIIVGGSVGTNVYAKNQHQQAVTQALETIKKEKLTLEQLQKAVDELRDKENPNFFAKEVDLNTIDSIQKQIVLLKNEHKNDSLLEVKKENKEVVTKLDRIESDVKAVDYQVLLQEKVSELFIVKDNRKVINGTDFNLEFPTVDDLTLDEIEAVVTPTKNGGNNNGGGGNVTPPVVEPCPTASYSSYDQALNAGKAAGGKRVAVVQTVYCPTHGDIVGYEYIILETWD